MSLILVENEMKIKKKIKFLNNQVVISLVFILLLTLFIFFILQGYFNLKINSRNYQATLFDTIDQRMSSILSEANNFPRSGGNDVLFLSKLYSLKKFVNLGEDRANELVDLKYNFFEFLKENTAYYQLRYINEFGDEIIKVVFNGKDYKLISKNELKNQKENIYFRDILKLDKGDVYISRLNLDIDKGILISKTVDKDSGYVPMIRYGTPVFNDRGENKGVIISNVYADYFLEDIRRSGRDGEEIFLINQEGYYLAHNNRSKEFGFMFKANNNNFYEDYSILKKDMIINGGNRIETENLIFSFRFVYPTATSFEIYKGSKKLLGNNSEKKYYWILVSISDKDIIEKINDKFKTNYLFSLIFMGFIIFMIVILLFVMGGLER